MTELSPTARSETKNNLIHLTNVAIQKTADGAHLSTSCLHPHSASSHAPRPIACPHAPRLIARPVACSDDSRPIVCSDAPRSLFPHTPRPIACPHTPRSLCPHTPRPTACPTGYGDFGADNEEDGSKWDLRSLKLYLASRHGAAVSEPFLRRFCLPGDRQREQNGERGEKNGRDVRRETREVSGETRDEEELSAGAAAAGMTAANICVWAIEIATKETNCR